MLHQLTPIQEEVFVQTKHLGDQCVGLGHDVVVAHLSQLKVQSKRVHLNKGYIVLYLVSGDEQLPL